MIQVVIAGGLAVLGFYWLAGENRPSYLIIFFVIWVALNLTAQFIGSYINRKKQADMQAELDALDNEPLD